MNTRSVGKLRFDMSEIVNKVRQMTNLHVEGLTIKFPFVNMIVKVDDTEKRIANEVVIRLADRRVLSGPECCDNCIDDSLGSLQGIREIIVDKQVELYDAKGDALYLLLEMMAEGLRQFLTYEQRLDGLHREPVVTTHPEFRRAPEAREAYFVALESLRGHLNRCTLEIAKIGDVTLPKVAQMAKYQSPWPVEEYIKVRLKKL